MSSNAQPGNEQEEKKKHDPEIPIWVQAKPAGGVGVLAVEGLYFVAVKGEKFFYFKAKSKKIRDAIMEGFDNESLVKIVPGEKTITFTEIKDIGA